MESTEFRINLARQIRARRAYLDITQEKLHEISSVALGTIKDLEKAIANPRLDTLEKIAIAFKIELRDLLCSDGVNKIENKQGRG